MAYDKISALRLNTQALSLAWDIARLNRVATADERSVLALYSGFGGIKEVLSLHEDGSIDEGIGLVWHDPLRELLALLRSISPDRAPDLLRYIKNSVLTAFYTPPEAVRAVASALNHTLSVYGYRAESVLETSAGIGGFIGICPGARCVGFEKDVASSLVLSALNPSADIHNECFENISRVVGEKFDVVASNIPFGDVKVFDESWLGATDEVHQMAQKKLHTYFFIKGMEQLAQGGILSFITSRAIIDTPGNEYVRRWMVANGRLLASVRLPDNLFCGGSGIEVGSDLIVFQRDKYKFSSTIDESEFIRGACPSAAVYTEKRSGTDQYGKACMKYYWREDMARLELRMTEVLRDQISQRFSPVAWHFGHSKVCSDVEMKVAQLRAGLLPDRAQRSKAKASGPSPIVDHDKFARDYSSLMSCYRDLHENERRNKIEFRAQREELNALYDKFISRYGSLHENEALVRTLPDYNLALSLEKTRADGSGYEKADVFFRPVAFTLLDPDRPLSAMEALFLSLNEFGRVDMEYMSRCSHLEMSELYEALRGEIFLMVGEDGEPEWQHKSRTINSNVIAKRKSLEQYVSSHPEVEHVEWLRDTVRALREATPKPIAYEEIDIQLGVRWLPVEFLERFIMHLFKCNRPRVIYTAANDLFTIIEGEYRAEDEGSMWGKWRVRCEASGRLFTGYEVMEHALLDRCPAIVYTRRDVKLTDHEGMRLLQRQIDAIRSEFESWIKGPAISGAEREAIARLYNETFNCNVKADFNGSMQRFPFLDLSQMGFADLYQSQKDAVLMNKVNFGGAFWHTVGAGKTVIMCVSAFEMHRLGLAVKPVIIGLKANVAQIAETFRKLYPTGRLLYPGKDDFTRHNRGEFFSKIRNNDWDCIIMTHDQFGRIPLTPEVQDELAREEMAEIDAALEAMVGCHGEADGRVKKGLEKRKQNLEAAIQERRARIGRRGDDALTFREMGIDFIQVDEYQQFKNLAFTTRHGRVAGLGNNTGSSRASHLLTCIRDIQLRRGSDMCAAFYSGTIITNALTELYVLFKYLRPLELRRMGITCFDAWAALYIKKTSEIELTMTNTLKEKERFRTYLNVPELTQFLQQMTDYRSAAMINLDVPRRKDIFDLADPTPEQEMLLGRIARFAETGCWADTGLPEEMASAHLDKSLMLVVTNLARKVALDPRLIDEHRFHDEPGNKCRRCAKNIYDVYMEFDSHKGTQFVFTDLSSFDRSKWNVCQEIRDILVNEYHLPSEEITFINLHESDVAKQRLFEKMNSGEVRVLFGSTTKLGTGVNAQRRAVAVHHLDAPWRPADLEQRDGRAVRHGNEVKVWGGNEVRIYTYGTKKTLDSYKYNLLTNKALFISQIANASVGSRRLDEDGMSAEDGMSYGELKALLSGNEDLLTMARLDNRIKVMASERDRIARLHHEAQDKIRDRQLSIDRLTSHISKLSDILTSVKVIIDGKSVAQYIDPADHNRSLIPASVLSIDGAKSQRVEDLGRALKAALSSSASHASAVEIGRYCSMPIMACQGPASDGASASAVLAIAYSGQLFRCSERGYDLSSFAASLCYFDGLIPSLTLLINSEQGMIASAKAEIAQCRKQLEEEWDGEAELALLSHQYDEIQKRVSTDLAEKEQARQEALVGKK